MKRKGGAHDLHQQLLILKEENTKLKEMVNGNGEVDALRQENRVMRQELHMMKTSPRLQIGYGGNDVASSPNKTVSEAAFSYEADMQHRRSIDPERRTEPTPANKAPASKGREMSPQLGGGGFFMTQSAYNDNT